MNSCRWISIHEITITGSRFFQSTKNQQIRLAHFISALKAMKKGVDLFNRLNLLGNLAYYTFLKNTNK